MFNFSRSRKLVSQSFAVLKHDKELLLFPILSGIFELLVIASFTVPFWYFGFDLQQASQDSVNVSYYLFLYAFYVVSYFVVIFFNTGLVYCAHKRLTGGDPTFREGISYSLHHLHTILSWVLLSATVGLVLRIIADRAGLLGKLFSFLAGTAWSLVTYLIVPILVFDNKGVVDSVKYSAELFKKTWGEQVKGEISMGLFFFLLIIAPIPAAFVLDYALIQAGLPVFLIIGSTVLVVVAYWLLLMIVSSALQGVFTAALYIYAKTGTVPTAFSPELITGAFKKKELPVKQTA